jgi:hypothetical protein
MPVKFEADQEAIFSMAFGLKINQKKMKRLEKEYTTMKCKEKEDEIELRVGVGSFYSCRLKKIKIKIYVFAMP